MVFKIKGTRPKMASLDCHFLYDAVMKLDDDRCYEALKSRDARFDGLFYVGVRTTGIYCRPVCPARRPLRKNVDFFRHPAEAEATGLRPCLKCRPETAPGTPAWQGTATTVSRALRLISEGLQDDLSVEDLAAQLGVTDRHLRRLFNEHLGATPVAVAQLYRVQLAKRLVSDTSLPFTEVAFASGFNSLRRFNAAFKNTYGRAPRDLRRESAASKRSRGDETFTVHLSYRPPFDIDAQLAYLTGRAIPGVEVVSEGQYRRVVQFGDAVGTICVEDGTRENQLRLHVDVELAGYLPQIVERIRRLFDLYAEPDAIRDALNTDPTLRKLLKRRPGQRVPGAWCPFELTMRAILGQQISVKGATTLSGRLVEKYGEKLKSESHPGLTHAFPTPERLSRVKLNSVGVPLARAEALRGVARAFAQGELNLGPGTDPEVAYEKLVSLKGIGPWTAQYVLMRGLGDPDAFPIDDLGIINALDALEGARYKGKKLLERAEAWRPWRGYATLHLWASLSD